MNTDFDELGFNGTRDVTPEEFGDILCRIAEERDTEYRIKKEGATIKVFEDGEIGPVGIFYLQGGKKTIKARADLRMRGLNFVYKAFGLRHSDVSPETNMQECADCIQDGTKTVKARAGLRGKGLIKLINEAYGLISPNVSTNEHTVYITPWSYGGG